MSFGGNPFKIYKKKLFFGGGFGGLATIWGYVHMWQICCRVFCNCPIHVNGVWRNPSVVWKGFSLAVISATDFLCVNLTCWFAVYIFFTKCTNIYTGFISYQRIKVIKSVSRSAEQWRTLQGHRHLYCADNSCRTTEGTWKKFRLLDHSLIAKGSIPIITLN